MENIYIYSFINKLNGHRYIGKTNNPERRCREHKSLAFNEKIIGTAKDCTWYKKIRQYGWDNFAFEILEVATTDNWTQRERYWIKFYNTYHGVGYNETEGGDDHPHLMSLTEEEAQEVRTLLLSTKMKQKDIADEYYISSTLVSNINQGQKYRDDKLSYPLRKNYKTLADYGELITLLRTTNKTFKEIAKELSMAESSVKKINYGKMHFDPYMDYPIRKINSFDSPVEQIIQLLRNSQLTINEISEQTGKSVATIRRINRGETHHNPELTYPIRK